MNELDPQRNRRPERIRHIHLLGVCGTGMAALAGMLKKSGYEVTGSDNQVYPPMSDFLAQAGIAIKSPYAAENLHPHPDLAIVGNVISKNNPEAQELARLGIAYLSFPQALAQFFIAGKKSLVVAGTHGKTTTASILATALNHAGLDPSFMIGGIVREFGGNFRLGAGQCVVLEGDEYDTAFFDKGSKFLHYQPWAAILTSLEFDHADIFADLQAVKNAFAGLVALPPKDGLLVAHLDEPNVAEVAAKADCRVLGYGLAPERDWRLVDVRHEGNTSYFKALYRGQLFGDFTLPAPGRHNCLNALAVIALLADLGLDAATIAAGLMAFAGVKRRQEVRGVECGVTVIDDFAHHPTAVKETLTALKSAYVGQRLIAVFEPRTNSSRRAVFQNDYAKAFDEADMILLRQPLPLDTVAPELMFSSKRLTDDLRQRGKNARVFADATAMIAALLPELRQNDVVAILSNGGFDGIHERLLAALRQRA
ncbi:MAG: UDP-N-acetylmuramate:L-alanyl-gamma-D-glutamyl-meso-diaminopimelate ligase [Desulfobulbaceae bacterium]|nr:UDP-N-acetylmuramate:L-alanyl-gamma-D-glutamyl-meso-diaminopimelate ligase [Desulfobulbaceae bacterium]